MWQLAQPLISLLFLLTNLKGWVTIMIKSHPHVTFPVDGLLSLAANDFGVKYLSANRGICMPDSWEILSSQGLVIVVLLNPTILDPQGRKWIADQFQRKIYGSLQISIPASHRYTDIGNGTAFYLPLPSAGYLHFEKKPVLQ